MTDKIEWRDIPGYEGEYKVSSDGQVKSLPRVVKMKNGRTRTICGKLLRPHKAGYGYLQVRLRADDRYYVHRLVALAFLDRKSADLEVNHKDENKQNNCVKNLEWVTRQENLAYGTRNNRSKEANMRKARRVVSILDGKVFCEFESIHAAERDGFSRSCISFCCRRKNKKHKGFFWRYKEDFEEGASFNG